MDLPCGCKTEYKNYKLLLKTPCEKHVHASHCYKCDSKNIQIGVFETKPRQYGFSCAEKAHEVMRYFHIEK